MEADDRTIRTLTLEAFADTIIPGEKRFPEDRAIAGVATGGGAVQAGAVALLEEPASGVDVGLDPLTGLLNQLAADYAQGAGVPLDDDVPAFVALPYEHRTKLIQQLTAQDNPARDGWIVLAMFSNMAYDIGAHMHTADALAAGHPGLTAMGFAKPDADGLWRFPEYGYGRKLAEIHPDTTESGSPA